MDYARQPEHDTYRLVISRNNGAEVLLAPIGEQFLLPSVLVSRRERFGDCLTSVVKDSWGREVVCLFSPELPTAKTIDFFYYVLECCGSRSALNDDRAGWVLFSRLSPEAFVDATDYEAVCQSLTTWERHSNGFAPGPFAKPGWFEELRTWAEDAIRPLGYQLKSEFRQFNASPKFSLIRLATSGPAVWFKAVGEPNLREFPISKTLAELIPGYVPKIIAARPDWNGWLATEAVGNNVSDLEGWKAAARALAMVQVATIQEQSHLLNSGAHDLRVNALLGTLDEFLNTMGELMEQQTKISPPAMTWKEVCLLGEHIEDALAFIVKSAMPDSLGHLDLNPDNIIVLSGRCTFLDWSEGYVGHPFYSFNYLLEHFRRCRDAGVAGEAQIREAYVEPWARLVSEKAIVDALAYAPLIAIFAYSVAKATAINKKTFRNPSTEAYLRSLTRRMKREADQLISRRIPCL